MIYLCDKQGVIKAVLPTPVNQGSVGVNEIVFIAPFPTTSTVSLAITLPNGVLVYPQPFPAATSNYPYNMTLAEDFSGILDGGYNVWSMKLDKTLTQISGTARISFFVTGSDGTVSTPEIDFYINKTSPYLLNVTGDDLNTIGQYITRAKEAAEEAEYYATTFWDVIIDGSKKSYTAAELQATIRAAVGNVLVKKLTIEYLFQPNPLNAAEYVPLLFVPNTVRHIHFSQCAYTRYDGYGGSIICGEYTVVGSQGLRYINNDTLITGVVGNTGIISDDAFGAHILPFIMFFSSVRDCIAGVISHSDTVSHCKASLIDSCALVSNINILNRYDRINIPNNPNNATSRSIENVTITNCWYVDSNTVFNPIYEDGEEDEIRGMVQIAEYIPTFKRLPQSVDASITGSTLNLKLRGIYNEVISNTDVELPFSSVYRYKGSVRTYANLPSNASVGDVYNVESAYGSYPAGTNFAWNGEAWDALGGSITAEIVNGIIAQYLEDNPIYTPSITVTPIDNGHRVVINDKNGTNSFDVMNGITPIRGVNYWTPADIAEIQSYVDDAILGGEW